VIFVTVGSLFPFDRLVRAMDDWGAGRDEELVAQIGDGAYAPRHMRWTRRLERGEFEATVARARLVVAHAGVGTVVTAARFGRPAVVLPRRRRYAEHTSDHQVETAGWLAAKPGVYVAAAEHEIPARIEAALALPPDRLATIPPHAPPELIARLRRFILD
jgi:UDP-N-acetylglucosamine transferase subunit ALG13